MSCIPPLPDEPRPLPSSPGPSNQPDPALWIAFGLASLLAIVAAFYRGAKFDDSTKALATGLSGVLLILILWAAGYIHHVGRKKDSRRFLRYAGRTAILVTGFALLSDMRRGNPPRNHHSLIVDLKDGRLTPDEFIRVVRKQTWGFDATLLRDREKAQRLSWAQEHPSAELSNFRWVSITDRDALVRMALAYDGRFTDEGTTRSVQGAVVALFDRAGMANLEAVCVPELADCSRVPALLQEAERNITKAIQHAGLSGLLPQGGICAEEQATHPILGSVFPTISCEYSDGRMLSVVRHTRTEMAEQMLLAEKVLAKPSNVTNR